VGFLRQADFQVQQWHRGDVLSAVQKQNLDARSFDKIVVICLERLKIPLAPSDSSQDSQQRLTLIAPYALAFGFPGAFCPNLVKTNYLLS